MTTVSQKRWHNLVSSVLDKQLWQNGYSAEFVALKHHFIGNVDEACIMANDENLFVVGEEGTKKSNKDVMDSRYSITMIRSGTAANASGHFLFLGCGKEMKSVSLSERNLV